MNECPVDNTFLQRHSMFGGLTDEELTIIRRYLIVQRFSQGSIILRQGEPNNSVYFITKGSVSIQKHSEHHPYREIALLHEGDSFGEMELIDIQPCAASVQCVTDTEIVLLHNRDLYELSKSELYIYTMIILNLARDISRRLRVTDELLAQHDGAR